MPIRTHPPDVSGALTDAAQDTTEVAPAPAVQRLRARDAAGVLIRAVGRARADHATNLAQSVAFNLFLAIPSAALVAVGVFATAGDAGLARRLLTHLEGIVPASAITLIDRSLAKVTHQSSGGAIMIAVGALLAIWSLTGAMKTLIWALNVAHDVPERRGFLRTRIAAIAMLACAGTAFVLVFVLLVLGPQLSNWIGAAVNQPTAVSWTWWTVQWPVLVAALLIAFGGVYRFGPDLERPTWRVVTPGTLTALTLWLALSGGFAWYVSNFGSYNKTWGSLSAVIVMLTWLWLSSLALLLGAEIDAEAERTRRRRGLERPS
jgi:membrane protein